MPETDITRLTITWSKDTDLALRSYLGSQGLKKGALSGPAIDYLPAEILTGFVFFRHLCSRRLSAGALKFVEDAAMNWRLFDLKRLFRFQAGFTTLAPH